ncbi:MAG: ISAs1 family transposase [Acidobacteriota bacterium]|nr:ISAs1 family transposase [Acidobacteriota bacterium]
MSAKTVAAEAIAALAEYFAALPDPRIERCRRHKLIDIVTIAICSALCGGEGFTDMEEFGHARQEWLATFLELPQGIPSHDTFGRVFARLSPVGFEACFARWVNVSVKKLSGEVVSLDGKRARHSYDKAAGKEAIELVSAWAREQRLTLGQVKVAPDSNEITAVPELLKVIEIEGAVVTVDALNTQKEIAAQIRAKRADYVMALKGNHGGLKKEVAALCQAIKEDRTYGYHSETHRTIDKEHGRIETRLCWHVELPFERLSEGHRWTDLRSVAMLEATREVGDKVSREVRYYLSSLEVNAAKMNEIIRGHWSIENSCHWVLDVVFREDDSRVRVGHAAQNLALVRKLALSMLNREKSCKRGVKIKRFKAALDLQYLLKILRN